VVIDVDAPQAGLPDPRTSAGRDFAEGAFSLPLPGRLRRVERM
jgi:hypothetical protein